LEATEVLGFDLRDLPVLSVVELVVEAAFDQELVVGADLDDARAAAAAV
jgi:hypothetical protein